MKKIRKSMPLHLGQSLANDQPLWMKKKPSKVNKMWSLIHFYNMTYFQLFLTHMNDQCYKELILQRLFIKSIFFSFRYSFQLWGVKKKKRFSVSVISIHWKTPGTNLTVWLSKSMQCQRLLQMGEGGGLEANRFLIPLNYAASIRQLWMP